MRTIGMDGDTRAYCCSPGILNTLFSDADRSIFPISYLNTLSQMLLAIHVRIDSVRERLRDSGSRLDGL